MSSANMLKKRRSFTVAEVDVINSNSFKQTQLNLDKQNLRLDKSHTDSMLLHNREYAELKRFLHSIHAVNGVYGENGAPGTPAKTPVRSVTAPGKDSLALVPVEGEHQTNRPKTVNPGVRRRSASDSSIGSVERGKGSQAKTEAASEPSTPRKVSVSGPDRLPRLMLPPSPILEDTPSWKQTRRSSEATPTRNTPSNERRKSSTVTLEFDMKGDAGGRRLSRTTSLDGYHQKVPPRKSSIGSSQDLNNNRDRHLSASFPLPSSTYMSPTSNLLHPKGTHSDHFSSSSSRSSSPMTGMPVRRHSVAHPISSTSIRKSVELSEGFAMDTKVYDPSVHADATGRRYSSSDEGSSTASGPTLRSSLALKPPAPKVSHAKSMEVMVASQKQILQRRKTMSQLNTRLMTPGECIEIQNKRRDRIHGGSEDGNKGGVWAREPFFVNQPGTGPNRKNSVTDKETTNSDKN